jgi:cytochrome c(L)
MTIRMLLRCWLILAAAMVGLPGLASAEDHENPYTGDPDAIVQGQRLWANTGCYTCHGETAEGALGPDLTDDDWVYRPTDATLFRAIAMGRSGTNMVAWGGELDPDEIWKIIAYVRSLYRGDPEKIIW